MKEQEKAAGKLFSRRAFVKGAAMSAAAFTIVPRHVLGGKGFVPPSDKVNIAGVGVGGMGKSNLKNLASENIVALCDVDFNYAGPVFQTYPKAKQYKDYRKMLEQKDIDAVVIATPDHSHAVIAMDCMKLGKHVYVQKPLTYTVQEARELTKAAKKYPKVVTQMGNQGHSIDDTRRIHEWINDGAIGKVTEVYVWTNRPIWPQGVPKPTETVAVPSTLDWELFLGPAPQRAYNPAYHPFKWRGWVDYGVSAIGDMGAHLIDQPNWALNLGAPTTITATSTPFGKDGDKKGSHESHPLSTFITYEFAARGDMPPVKMYWYDGGLMPPRPDELPDGEMLPTGGGVLMIGDKGKLLHETYGEKPRLLPASNMQEYKQPAAKLPRIKTSHEMNWANAIKGTDKISCDFAYAGPLTETMLLGVVATMVPGMKLKWDSANMKITNLPEAEQFLKREYRQGWALSML